VSYPVGVIQEGIPNQIWVKSSVVFAHQNEESSKIPDSLRIFEDFVDLDHLFSLERAEFHCFDIFLYLRNSPKPGYWYCAIAACPNPPQCTLHNGSTTALKNFLNCIEALKDFYDPISGSKSMVILGKKLVKVVKRVFSCKKTSSQGLHDDTAEVIFITDVQHFRRIVADIQVDLHSRAMFSLSKDMGAVRMIRTPTIVAYFSL
jgi:hypothetical protein